MKKILLFSIGLMLTTATSLFAQSSTFVTENATSELRWTAEKVTGSHTGLIAIKSGEFSVENEMIKSGNVVIDMTSITDDDIQDEGTRAKLVGHLKSEDFFNVEKFPTASFQLNSFTPNKKDSNYLVAGILTIKGISQPIEFPAQVEISDGTLTAKGDAVFDRAKYDVRYNSSSFFSDLGDYMIYDEVKLAINLTASAK